jgi:nitroimidazol reductase NimA-like FMN-containing flavoprotein (pyridoxamine 5'-phosphate oxidase superfamily)
MSESAGGPLGPAELDEFLAQPLLLKLACVRPDGWPYVIPLWYAWYEHKLYVVGRERAVWIGYIRREPRVGVLIDEDVQRHRRVQMTARAAVVEGPAPRGQGSPRWHALDRLLVGRYMADEQGQAYRQLTADRPRYLIEITPLQVTSWRGGPWHPRYYRPEPAEPPPTAIIP